MGSTDSQMTAALEKRTYLWEEYKYRHDLIWQRTFTFTTAITLISIIPYLQQDIARLLEEWILIVPSLAFLLAGIGLGVMLNELALFGKIKKEYRERQNEFLGKELNDPNKKGTFRCFVTVYFVGLLLLSIFNWYVVWQIWIPRL